jgi:predicted LPLAT superfamily acyltransferase
VLGRGAAYACLAVIAPYFYVFAPRARRASLEFFAAARPRTSWLARRVQVIKHFYTFGTILLDRLHQSYHDASVFDVAVQGLRVFERAVASGRGVIVLTAHVGGWDLSARLLARNHLGAPSVIAELVVSGRQSSDATYRAGERSGGAPHRASTHNEAQPLLAYKELLQRGEVAGMMGDRPQSEKLALVPFLGRLAAFDVTPFRIAAVTGAKIVYCFAFKTGYSRYELELVDALPPVRGQDDEAARHFAGALARRLQDRPHQWLNFFPFFSTRPTPVGSQA